MRRVCPVKDTLCPHGMKCDGPCAFDRYACASNWPDYLSDCADRDRAEKAWREYQRKGGVSLDELKAELGARPTTPTAGDE